MYKRNLNLAVAGQPLKEMESLKEFEAKQKYFGGQAYTGLTLANHLLRKAGWEGEEIHDYLLIENGHIPLRLLVQVYIDHIYYMEQYMFDFYYLFDIEFDVNREIMEEYYQDNVILVLLEREFIMYCELRESKKINPHKNYNAEELRKIYENN